LHDCIRLASVEGRFECLDLSMLAGNLLLDYGNLTLMLHSCSLKSVQPFSLTLLMLLNRRFILVAAGLESGRVALSCPGY
jgi:succinate-acetate transporter protein